MSGRLPDERLTIAKADFEHACGPPAEQFVQVDPAFEMFEEFARIAEGLASRGLLPASSAAELSSDALELAALLED